MKGNFGGNSRKQTRWDIFHCKNLVIISRPIIKNGNCKADWNNSHRIRDACDGKRLNVCRELGQLQLEFVEAGSTGTRSMVSCVGSDNKLRTGRWTTNSCGKLPAKKTFQLQKSIIPGPIGRKVFIRTISVRASEDERLQSVTLLQGRLNSPEALGNRLVQGRHRAALQEKNLVNY